MAKKRFYRKEREDREGKPYFSWCSENFGTVPASLAAVLSSRNPLDTRTQLRELLLDALVATIEVIDPIDSGLTFGNQTRDDEARRSTQVGRHDGRALQPADSAHDRGVSRDLDVRAETLHFQGMHEPVLENGLGDDGSAFRYRVQRHQLCLHVGRERRIGSGPDIDPLGPPPHVERELCVTHE